MASGGLSTSRVTRAAPSLDASPDSVLLLVIKAKQPLDAGRSGRTTPVEAALSRMMSIRFPLREVRNNEDRSARVVGMFSLGTLSARRKASSAWLALRGAPGP